MTALLSRRTASIVAAIATTGALATTGAIVGASSASADPGDVVTSGTTTLSQSAGTVYAGAINGLLTVPVKPATVSYNETTKGVETSFPVTGGDGSAAAAYGSIKHGGALYVINAKAGKSVKLTNITFSFETSTLSATPAGATAPVDVLTLAGSQSRTRDAATGSQTVDATSTALTPAAAAYLDKALATRVFKAGQSLGSFHTEFVNTDY